MDDSNRNNKRAHLSMMISDEEQRQCLMTLKQLNGNVYFIIWSFKLRLFFGFFTQVRQRLMFITLNLTSSL